MDALARTFILLMAISRTSAFLLPAASPRTCRIVNARPMLKAVSSRNGGDVDPFPKSEETQGASKDDGDDQNMTVFDAEGAMSWDDYKIRKPGDYELSSVDEMLCWAFDECPVSEDQAKAYTMRWQIHSAEKTPTMVTHFDSEGDWEEEDRSAWSKKWFEDVGADDLRRVHSTAPVNGYVKGHMKGCVDSNVKVDIDEDLSGYGI